MAWSKTCQVAAWNACRTWYLPVSGVAELLAHFLIHPQDGKQTDNDKGMALYSRSHTKECTVVHALTDEARDAILAEAARKAREEQAGEDTLQEGVERPSGSNDDDGKPPAKPPDNNEGKPADDDGAKKPPAEKPPVDDKTETKEAKMKEPPDDDGAKKPPA
jgi:hypothetical protein